MIRLFKVVFILLLVNPLFNDVLGQDSLPPKNIKREIIGLTPADKNRIISGLAIGLTAHPWSTWADTFYVKVNGLNIEAGPLGIIGGIWGTMFGFFGSKDSLKHTANFFSAYGYADSSDLKWVRYGTKINGISVSIGGITETFNTGLIINGFSGTSYTTNGVQITGLLNMQYEFKGILIAGIANKTQKGKGLQIGLINNCQSGRLIQIGLFNRIGKRVLPFINFSLEKKKNNA